MMRAAWLAQEILTTFSEDIGEVALQPGHGGILEIRLNNELIFSRKESGRFPEAKMRTDLAGPRSIKSELGVSNIVGSS